MDCDNMAQVGAECSCPQHLVFAAALASVSADDVTAGKRQRRFMRQLEVDDVSSIRSR
jgi:hypothetical protein